MDTDEYSPSLRSPYKLIPMSPELTDKLSNTETTITPKPKVVPDLKCSKCHGQRIVTGSVSDSHRARCFFAPAGLKFWTITKSYGTKLESYACIDCGLVWMETSAKMLEDFVRNYCDQKIK